MYMKDISVIARIKVLTVVLMRILVLCDMMLCVWVWQMLMFQRNISFIIWMLVCFILEQEDITCLQNVRNHSHNDTAAHPRRPESP